MAMTPLYAIFDATHLGTDLELEQSGTVLTVNAIANINRTALALFPESVGRWYAEFLVYGPGTLLASVGIATVAASLTTYVGGDANGFGYRLDLGEIRNNGAAIDGSPGAPVAAKGDVIGVLLDLTMTQPTVSWYRNGALVYSANLASTGPWALAVSLGGSEAYGLRCFINAGQRAFAYPVPGVAGWYEPPQTVRGLRLASEDWLSDAADDVPNERYSGLLAGDNSELRAVRSLDFWPWQRGVQTGAMVLTAYDASNAFAEILSGDSRDLPVTISAIDAGETYADRVNLFSAVIDSVSAVDDLSVKLTCRDPLGLLDVPVQRAMIRPDAEPSAANTPRPIVLGACRNVPTVLTDSVNLIYAVTDATVLGIGFVRDSGYPLDPAAIPADFTLDASKTSLLLHAAPIGKVTADISSVGGQQLPAPADDILDGAGDPLSGGDGDSPTGLPDGAGDFPPLMAGGVLRFPQAAPSATIRVEAWVATSGLISNPTVGVRLRVIWFAPDGSVTGYDESPIIGGTTAYTKITLSSTAPAGSSFGYGKVFAWNHDTTAGGHIYFGGQQAWYVTDDGDIEIPQDNHLFAAGNTGWFAEENWVIRTDGAHAHTGSGYAEHLPAADLSGYADQSGIYNKQWAHVLSPGVAGWQPLTSAQQFGGGKSYQVIITIAAIPSDGVAVALATGTTVDSVIAKWTKPGTYTVQITNTGTTDHDLYLLTITKAGLAGTTPTAPTVSAIQILEYDDTYTPDPADLTPALLEPIKLADYMHQVLDLRGATVGVSWSESDAHAIDTASGYDGIGVYLGGGETVGQALDMALASYTACKWCDGNGTIRFTRMIAPESVDEGDRAGTIDINALGGDLVPVMDNAPGLTTQMGVRRNWAQFSDGDLVAENLPNFPLAIRQSMLRAFQQTASSAKPLAGAYRHALYAAPIASCFDQQADGQAEIDRIAAIYTTPRWFYACSVFLDALPSIDLGQVWTLTYPKYGLASGKAVMVIDYEPDLLDGTANIILWG